MHVRTRIAPSPTGTLHVGTARTALFNYLFSKHEKGEFLLRIEDTDLERSDKKYEEDIVEGLRWLGIDWDGEITRQSERIETYKKYIQRLLKEGNAFYCFHSEKELGEERQQQIDRKIPMRHLCTEWRNLSLEDAEKKRKAGEQSIIRFKISRDTGNEQITFHDLIRNQIHFFVGLLGDFSIAKSTDIPLYNFAVVIDDYEMKISHVIRGEDHIPNTPKQLLIAKALGWTTENEIGDTVPPWDYAHLPLTLGPDRSKLSKRHGATSVNEYKEAGYLPKALFNFMALLGWNSGGDQEIFSKEELIKEFSLGKIQKAGAIFDLVKLDWMNGEYIRQKSLQELLELAKPYLPTWVLDTQVGVRHLLDLEKIISLEQPRLKKLSELPGKIDYFFKEPEYDASLLKWKQMDSTDIKKSLEISKELISNFQPARPAGGFPISKQEIEKVFLDKIGEGDKGFILWPLRVALSGKKASPGPFEIMEILGKEKSISRVQTAIDKLSEIIYN